MQPMIAYGPIIATVSIQHRDFQEYVAGFLSDRWCYQYHDMPAGDGEIVQMHLDGYEFLFDLMQDRVVAAYGVSWYNPAKRDAERMGGFLGRVTSQSGLDRLAARASTPAEAQARQKAAGKSFRERFFEEFGTAYDRGHFISLRQGGVYDVNLFPQRADINQGKSERGKVYRAMETKCVTEGGIFCFSRPIYDDETWVPCRLEYGLARDPSDYWIEVFPNKPD